MKAVVYAKYGSTDVLELKEIEEPILKDNEVLIKIYAASVNSWDWDLLRGKPYLYRLIFGLIKPKYKILGADIAGKVDAVGRNVKRFQVGDEVFGDISDRWGGFAEYVCASESTLSLKPNSMKFEEAAAIPQAAVLALQSFGDIRQFEKEYKILINGAGGGVGTFALQMAKLFGAEVTCVDSLDKLDMLLSLGADHVIDYKQEDFTKNGIQYNLIIDVVAKRSIFRYKHSLLPNGIFVLVGGTISAILQTAFLGTLLSRMGNKKLGILMHKPNYDIEYIKELFESGKVVPVIDKCYPLNETAMAFQHLGEGHVKGKVVVTIVNN